MLMNSTPLRYPGGKQKLTTFIYEIMERNNLLGGDYVEPYAGGAGVATNLLLSGAASKIHLNDSSYPVYSFWYSILNETDEFCRRVSRASLTIDEWRRKQYIASKPREFDKLEVGFAMFYLNRCNRSGILNAGVIGGLNQDGKWKMDARFPRNSLISKIELIASHKNNIKIRNWDAEKFMTSYISKLPKKTLVYFDPPYFNKASNLYTNHYQPEDHERIALSVQKITKHPWIVSYDNTKEILDNYKKRKKFIYSLQYSAFKAYKGSEVFIFSDKVLIPRESTIPFIDTALA